MVDDQEKIGPQKAKVVLVSIPLDKDKYEVVKVLASQLGVTFEEADELLEELPIELIPSIPIEAGETFAEAIREAGGEVEVLPIGPKAGRFCSTHQYRRARARCKEPGCDKFICEICVKEANGKLLCPDCYRRFKRRRVVIALGSVAGLVILVALWFTFSDPILRMVRYMKPLSTSKVAIVLVAHELDESMAQKYTKITQSESPREYVYGEEHAIQDIDGWFQREYKRLTGDDSVDILEIDIYGLYQIGDEIPEPDNSGNVSMDGIKANREFKKFFAELNDINNLKLDPYDIVMYVELVQTSGVKNDFMEFLGMWHDDIGYVKFPVQQIYSTDYYIMAVAHYIARIMGATVQLDNNGFPLFPTGYAEPKQIQRHPQEKAELMGCYIPAKAFEIHRINTLDDAIIGENTAYEMGWISSSARNQTYADIQP